ncbi:MAG: hypothetical protein A3J24_01175 [Deltaproteobacteria bacterium RIFCSPLOWO2_02_FULL_53_8]|nr:MAG: hypothetical protein A3J24_01175 [Deltaproteobacteria bacterium RIFCSPLOWO2_02_FULL_53_8]
MPDFSAPVFWRWCFWICLLAVLALSVMHPSPHMPTTGWDKTNHLLAFAVLALLGCRAHPDRSALVLALLLAYGGLIELLQSLTSDRFAELADLLADGVGLCLGWGVARLLNRLGRRNGTDALERASRSS